MGVEQLILLLQDLLSEVVLIGNILSCIARPPVHLTESLCRENEDEGVCVHALCSGISYCCLEALATHAHLAVELRYVLLQTYDVGLEGVEFLFQLMDARESVVQLQAQEIDVLLTGLHLLARIVELCFGLLQLALELRLLLLQLLHLLAVLCSKRKSENECYE